MEKICFFEIMPRIIRKRLGAWLRSEHDRGDHPKFRKEP